MIRCETRCCAVQRLLALASSDNIHEAQSAMKAAQRLMLRHNIEAVETIPNKFDLNKWVDSPAASSPYQDAERYFGGSLFVRCIWVFAWDVSKAKKGRVWSYAEPRAICRLRPTCTTSCCLQRRECGRSTSEVRGGHPIQREDAISVVS